MSPMPPPPGLDSSALSLPGGGNSPSAQAILQDASNTLQQIQGQVQDLARQFPSAQDALLAAMAALEEARRLIIMSTQTRPGPQVAGA